MSPRALSLSLFSGLIDGGLRRWAGRGGGWGGEGVNGRVEGGEMAGREESREKKGIEWILRIGG